MEKQLILQMLDELIEAPPGTLKGGESINSWDSITMIGLIALADETFHKSLTADLISKAVTVDDVVSLLQG